MLTAIDADLNQNDNRVKLNNVPDYEEPFLRFAVDRPEFLYGMDMMSDAARLELNM